MDKISKNQGFSTLEYAVFIAILIIALLGMSTYLTRAVCGKFRASADTFGFGRQYRP